MRGQWQTGRVAGIRHQAVAVIDVHGSHLLGEVGDFGSGKRLPPDCKELAKVVSRAGAGIEADLAGSIIGADWIEAAYRIGR